MNVEAENAVYRERARIREELLKLETIDGIYTTLIKRSDVLAIISNEMPNNGKI